jgi:threonyl-tRNA synthetase
LTPDGVFHDAEMFDFSGYMNLKKFYQYEIKKIRGTEKEPAHISLMKDLELVDYEPGSDPGNMRWYPKGYLIKKLLERKVEELCLSMGALEVDTPLLYDQDHPSLKKYVEKFPARQYIIKSPERNLFLRFAACFGQYLMAHDMTISYKHLPIRFFEIARSFRREKHGELSGIKRLRAFTMPDMHTLCENTPQALVEFMNQFHLSLKWMTALGLNCEVGIRFTRDFLEKHRDFSRELVQRVGKPILIEVWDERYFYFVIKFELNLNDSVNKAFALSTVQLDVDNPKSFNITYIDDKGKEKYPLLLHASISGGIDRCLCALLENEAHKISQGEKGSFPFWLSLTQVRIIPVKNEFLPICKEISSLLPGRVDIDDRDLSISKRIRDAEKEWVPIILVIGEKEEKKKVYTPRVRVPLSEDTEFTLQELQDLIQFQLKEYPLAPLPLPQLLSKRPRFRG